MESQHDRVTKQFGPAASAYATSSTHSDVAVLADLVSILAPQVIEEALDIATGAGNLALALAPKVKRVVALDLTPSMLAETARRAHERGLSNVETVQAAAEDLPFPDAYFDLVTVRTAPHHYADVRAAVREMARVVRPSGRVMIVDTYAPEDPALDAELNRIEVIRDPSHVRNYTASEWHAMVTEAGLEIVFERRQAHALGKRLDFEEWVIRMNVSAEDRTVLLMAFRNGGADFQKLVDFQDVPERPSFTLPEITLVCRPV